MDATYVSTRQFTVTGDHTTTFVVDRRLKCNCGGDGYKYSLVLNSSHADNTTTVNLTPLSEDITSNLTAVEWGVGTPISVPTHDHLDEETGGFLTNRTIYNVNSNIGYSGLDFDNLKTVIDRVTAIDKPANWSQMSMSTAQGGAELEEAYLGATFDGRYVYFAPRNSDTFVRFDTQGTFTTSGDWQRMNMSTAQGAAEVNNAYFGTTFDGRYVYFAPYKSDTFVRFDTQGTFTTSTDWQQMSMSTAQGAAALDMAYIGATFDGRYVYFTPYKSDTFIKFDTQGTFTTSTDWQQMNMSTAQGAAELDAAYFGAAFDGRYIYFVPSSSNTFIRFNTLGTFTTSTDWQQMSMSTAQGAAALDEAYNGATFDGRYVYFVPYNSDTFVRCLGLESGGGYGKDGSV